MQTLKRYSANPPCSLWQPYQVSLLRPKEPSQPTEDQNQKERARETNVESHSCKVHFYNLFTQSYGENFCNISLLPSNISLTNISFLNQTHTRHAPNLHSSQSLPFCCNVKLENLVWWLLAKTKGSSGFPKQQSRNAAKMFNSCWKCRTKIFKKDRPKIRFWIEQNAKHASPTPLI